MHSTGSTQEMSKVKLNLYQEGFVNQGWLNNE